MFKRIALICEHTPGGGREGEQIRGKKMKQKFDVVAGLAGITMWGVAAFALALAAAVRFGLLARCSIGFDVLSILGMLSIGVMIISIYFVKGSAAEAFNAGLERSVEAPLKIVRKIKNTHLKTFGHKLGERGAVAINLKPHPQKIIRTSGRQSGAKTDKKQSSGSKSDDSDGGDGEPPRPQQLCSYKTLARILDCSEKTLRNKVSAGKLPCPIQTIVGPRFPIEIVQSLLSPVKKHEQKQQIRPRGRPRIALAVRGGAA